MPLVLLLLATAVGVCNASPLPDEARKTRPSPVKESVLTQQPCSLRQVGQTLGKLLCLPFQGVGPSDFLLGYTWTRGKSERKAHPNYRDSDSEVNRLYKLCDVLEALAPPDKRPGFPSRDVKFDYYFPEPDYFHSLVPAAQSWVQKRDADKIDVIYIPITISADRATIKEYVKGRDFVTAVIIAELGHERYTLLVPNPGRKLVKEIVYDDSNNLPVAEWEKLKGVQEEQDKRNNMPKKFSNFRD
ncbi:hypothetical protein F5878DRAFT_707631 [Lentinula raphanica]|uniref:Uncharacterized protein n=1 Tax=Lentinula raphanica TaxID=153919 RepID=A0AA38PFX9_9AGAR|nr:hypothetical protein F5878DRAFT_707631 [Lentinula raphanica]